LQATRRRKGLPSGHKWRIGAARRGPAASRNSSRAAPLQPPSMPAKNRKLLEMFNLTEAAPRAGGDRPLSVSELTANVRGLLERQFPHVWVEGEISNWMVAASGHAYFALKDQGAMLSCVMWRSALQRATGPFADGDRVEAKGRLSVFEKRGAYQLTVEDLLPMGQGLLWRKFLALKAKLEAEGLFDPARKRPIPLLPRAVGVVTSPTGAAIRDILSILARRAPGLPVLIAPAKVQGEGAAVEIARGVRLLAQSGLVDVLIVGRGGGSMEDLWEFNDESLARAVAASPIPVISAVGHEVDFTICDFVADLRAATPSAAAELVSGEHERVHARAGELSLRLDRVLDAQLRDAYGRLRTAQASYAWREPERLLRDLQQRADSALATMDRAADGRVRDARARLGAASAALGGHDPALILRKGYAIVRRTDGRLVTRAAGLRPGTHIRTEFQDGAVRSAIVPDQADLFELPPPE